MDLDRAKEIVSTLAEGIDPLTGELLPSDHLCNKGDVVRAFYALLNAADFKKAKPQPENAGEPWTEQADAELRALFSSGKSMAAIGKQLGRTSGSVEARLAKLGLIETSWFTRGR